MKVNDTGVVISSSLGGGFGIPDEFVNVELHVETRAELVRLQGVIDNYATGAVHATYEANITVAQTYKAWWWLIRADGSGQYAPSEGSLLLPLERAPGTT